MSATPAIARPAIALPVAGALVLLFVGIVRGIGPGWGYGLFFVAGLLLAAGVGVFAVLMLTRLGATASLRATGSWLLLLGGWGYVFAVCALAGHYSAEAIAGRIELRWMVFGPVVLAALIALDVGLYRRIVAKNLPTWRRFEPYVTREQADPAAMRQTLVDDVLVHRSLREVSGFRWFKHTLIFWGFMLMFATELLAVVVREGFPAFGWPDVWEQTAHPLRLAFDFAYDFTGLMVLVGCVLAIGWRIRVNGTEQQKFSDTPTAVFLLLVVLSGFVLEGARLAAAPDAPGHMMSFVGVLFALVVPPIAEGSRAFDALWLGHVVGSCAFIAYVPARRLVHSCATPIGRLMISQRGLLDAKKKAVLGALMARRA